MNHTCQELEVWHFCSGILRWNINEADHQEHGDVQTNWYLRSWWCLAVQCGKAHHANTWPYSNPSYISKLNITENSFELWQLKEAEFKQPDANQSKQLAIVGEEGLEPEPERLGDKALLSKTILLLTMCQPLELNRLLLYPAHPLPCRSCRIWPSSWTLSIPKWRKRSKCWENLRSRVEALQTRPPNCHSLNDWWTIDHRYIKRDFSSKTCCPLYSHAFNGKPLKILALMTVNFPFGSGSLSTIKIERWWLRWFSHHTNLWSKADGWSEKDWFWLVHLLQEPCGSESRASSPRWCGSRCGW